MFFFKLWCKKNTKFAEKEIMKWFRRFRALCPRGNMTPDKLDTVYHKLFVGGDATFFKEQARKTSVNFINVLPKHFLYEILAPKNHKA